jgi:hypothetical protein
VGLSIENIRERPKIGNDGEDAGEKENCEPLRRAEPIRVACSAFMVSFAASPGSVKGTFNLFSVTGDLAGFAPARAVLDDPIRQRPLEADVMPGLLRLNPLVPEDFFALGLKLTVKRGVF